MLNRHTVAKAALATTVVLGYFAFTRADGHKPEPLINESQTLERAAVVVVEPVLDPTKTDDWHWREMEDIAVAMLGARQGEFEYHYHTCRLTSDLSVLVCTACYRHPKRLLGTQSVACTRKACTRLAAAHELETHQVDLAYCERENRRRE